MARLAQHIPPTTVPLSEILAQDKSSMRFICIYWHWTRVNDIHPYCIYSNGTGGSFDVLCQHATNICLGPRGSFYM